MSQLAQLLDALGSHRFRFSSETELHAGIADVLKASGIDFEREFRISPCDRLDFLCGSIGVEVKIKGSLADVTRQVHRYCQHESISAVVLVTTKANHRLVPTSINEKPVTTLWLGFQEAF